MSNYFQFGQIYRKERQCYIYLWHKISVTKYIMKYIFILYLFDVIEVVTFFYKVGQT